MLTLIQHQFSILSISRFLARVFSPLWVSSPANRVGGDQLVAAQFDVFDRPDLGFRCLLEHAFLTAIARAESLKLFPSLRDMAWFWVSLPL
jgi:hypothetical protein